MLENVKVRKSLFLVLKVGVILLVLFLFIQKIKGIKVGDFETVSIQYFTPLIIVIALFFLNWYFEWLKWKHTLFIVIPTSNIKNITSSLLSGITTGVITPNRIGNFIGRALYYPMRQRLSITIGTLYGNFAQFTATVFFGLVALTLYPIELNSIVPYTLLSLAILLILFYFLIPSLIKKLLLLITKKHNITNTLIQLKKILQALKFKLLYFSTFRYLVFVFQYALLFYALGEAVQINLIAGICVMYLISTLTPSLFFGKLLIRETTALYVLGTLIENPAVIIVSSLSLWVLNLGIPSLIGAYFLWKTKIEKT